MDEDEETEALRAARGFVKRLFGERESVIFDVNHIKRIGIYFVFTSIRPYRYILAVCNGNVRMFGYSGEIKLPLYLN